MSLWSGGGRRASVADSINNLTKTFSQGNVETFNDILTLTNIHIVYSLLSYDEDILKSFNFNALKDWR